MAETDVMRCVELTVKVRWMEQLHRVRMEKVTPLTDRLSTAAKGPVWGQRRKHHEKHNTLW